ncbi:hypothetical protein SAMN06265218_11285 [Fodinibius sediminis]|uniref:Uncharacterized protein n=1 Tax=Fodinibius sediminis TaxID=1214077 RepID=A0A521E1H0_9BACT|nr:hypothetical protein SAMN06265218_11285 [Fodinibius sediminis]
MRWSYRKNDICIYFRSERSRTPKQVQAVVFAPLLTIQKVLYEKNRFQLEEKTAPDNCFTRAPSLNAHLIAGGGAAFFPVAVEADQVGNGVDEEESGNQIGY